MTTQKIGPTLFLLWFAHFLVDVMLGIWPVYKTMAHLDLAKAGLIAGLGAMIGEGAQLIFGSLSDRGYRNILIKFGVVLTCTSVFICYTDNYYLYFICFLATCLGSGAFHPAASSLTNHLSSDRKAFFMTIFISGGALGMAVSQFLFSRTYGFFDGHMIVLAVPSLLLLLWMIFTKQADAPEAKLTAHDHATIKGHMLECLSLFRNRDMATLYLSQVSNQTIMWATVFLLPDVLNSRGYESWMVFGGGHFAFVLGVGLMMVPGGWLADRYGAKKVMTVANLLGAVMFYTFLMNPVLSNATTLILLFLMGTLGGVINPISIAFGNRLIPGKSGLVAAYLMGLVWCVAEFLGPGGGGLMASLFQEDAPAKALQIIALSFIPCTLFVMRLPNDARESHERAFLAA